MERESAFGIDSLLGDPAAQPLMKEWGLDEKEAERVARGIVSLSVSAVKK